MAVPREPMHCFRHTCQERNVQQHLDYRDDKESPRVPRPLVSRQWKQFREYRIQRSP